MLELVHPILVAICVFFVFLGVTPVLAGLYQYLLLPLSAFATHLEETEPYLPRVSILIPAWNEDLVIGLTIDRLVRLDYPPDRLRIYVIDDASSDDTPRVVIEKSKEYPGQVFHVRRVSGGEGKAHTLNYGLEILWKNSWTEAVLIMDADVLYRPDSLRKMARHLSDSNVGAVTAYIKEGSQSPNYVQRYITFEYITATGAARRAQNVLGFLICLSGGAQLHSRANLEQIGGRIFSDTLAEDTFTTFLSQLSGRRVLFDPHAVVLAEEPDSLLGLWKQRLRWARGNVQISGVFGRLWLNKQHHRGLGSLSMFLMWFSIFLMPVFQITASLGLISLYFLDEAWAWAAFHGLWIISGVVYLIVTLCSFVVDHESAVKCWLEGILFPGLVSLLIISYALWPPWIDAPMAFFELELGVTARMVLTLFLYAWLTLSMVVSYAAIVVEKSRYFSWLAPVLLLLGGYGAFLCAVTFGAYVKEIQGAEMKWDKTVKTGKVQ
ncbi:MAG: glycosyltransferase family 2 protein [Xanthomonadales bacterium]|nr:glycosyltransferase family 2 protein [Gammaproteobacteria bacterium]MBT8052425.1 glycosyltransferase family 2 protein [Gammaproteobacteria bacterium]NND55942.1 glycosyltransferase family 2 protein [Xanthomonadales bacterium]NNK50527.1 glycosyltransferase family 2 protein [Xanthomonadales bacterium]